MPDLPTRVRCLWLAFLAVWAGTLAVYGGVSPGAVAASAAAMAALTLAAMYVLPGPFLLSRPAAVFFAAVAALFALQLVPGLGFLFPWSSALRASHGAAGSGPGTADAFLTVRQAAQVAAYVMAGLFTMRLVQAGLPRPFAVTTLVGVLALEALYAAGQTGFRWETLPFFGKRLDLESASGTLVNRNNFAGLMAMGLALAAGVAWGRFAHRKRDEGRVSLVEAGLPWAVAAALFAAAIVLSKSRGGALAAGAGVAALAFVLRSRSRGAAIGGGVVLAAAAAITVWAANAEPLLQRFEGIEARKVVEDTRVVCWKATLAATARQPVLGFGIGSYPRAFRPFQPPSLPGQFQHAHSEYVNAAFEGGAAWLLLLVAGLALWLFRATRGLPSLDPAERAAARAAIAAVLAAAVHALVDFDLRITGVGLLFAALLGLAPAWSDAARPVPRFAAPLAALACALALWLAPLNPEGRNRTPDEIALHRTLTLSPCDADAAWFLARAAEARGDLDLAAQRFETAAALWPANPGTQLEAGVWLWRAGKRAPATVCLRRAFEGRPAAVDAALGRIEEDDVAVWEGLMPTPEAATHLAAALAREGLWVEAAGVFQRNVPATRDNVDAYDELAAAFGEAGQWGLEASTREARLAVHSDPWAHAAAARAWAKLEAWDQALENARIAMRLAPGSADGPVLVAEVLEAKGERLAAAQVLTDALGARPGDATLLLRRGQLYLQERMFTAAAEDARVALGVSPRSREAVFVLARALEGAGRREEAVAEVDRYLANAPGDAEMAELRRELAK